MSWDRVKFEKERNLKSQVLGEHESLHETSLAFLKKSYEFDYCYLWNWAGFPILNMPEDIVAFQEIIFRCKPTVIIETGVAWGGGIALSASLMSLYAPTGKVLGIDLNLKHELEFELSKLGLPVQISLLKASSTEDSSLAWVATQIDVNDRVMVILDSHHTHEHVLDELLSYSPLVSKGQFLVVGDTSVKDLADATSRSRPWTQDRNPHSALNEFLENTTEFVRDAEMNRKLLTSFHPGGYLRKL